MASRIPVVRQIGWLSVFPQLAFIAFCILIGWLFLPRSEPMAPVVFGVALYLLISNFVRGILTRHHRRGVSRLKAGDFAGAIPSFQAGYDYLARHAWIDRWRYLVLLSSSRMSYREMALCNIAFAYAQLGDGVRSRQTYERVLREFPWRGASRFAPHCSLRRKKRGILRLV